MATKRTVKRAHGAAGTKANTHKTTVRKKKPRTAQKQSFTGSATIRAWQDDPSSGLRARERPVPNLSKSPLKFKIKGAPVPPRLYALGTKEFRYWTAAEALRRGADFWAPLLAVKQWQSGPTLQVGLDEGTELNAYYDRTELAFFHDTAGGKVVYSGESPDVVCHEMGHACLDAHRPELWGAPFVQVSAFHESFGDMSAILSALQLKTVRQAALSVIEKNEPSQLSRCAEQLGWAIRQDHPTAVDKDCLRDACNKFQFVDPQTLPDAAPAFQLCAEPHSFSRIFTGAFYEILGGMLRTVTRHPSEADLADAATNCARLLIDATAAAPVQPNYFAQVASHMIDADTTRFSGKYRAILTSTFVKRKILPAAAVAPLITHKEPSARKSSHLGAAAFEPMDEPMHESIRASILAPPSKPQIQTVRLNAAELGLAKGTLIVGAPVERKTFVAVSATILQDSGVAAENVELATRRFVQMLIAHDRIETSLTVAGRRGVSLTASNGRRRTHVLIKVRQGLKLVRRQFDCSVGPADARVDQCPAVLSGRKF